MCCYANPVKHGDDGASRDETLPEAFWSVARGMRQLSAESLARWGITPSQSRALRALARTETMRLSELSVALHIAPRSATEVVDDLEAKQLVRRRPDPDDRRATLVELTVRGHTVHRAIKAAGAADAQRLFDRLTERERAELARILRKLRD